MISLPDNIHKALDILRGQNAWLVGGTVRDLLLGRPVKDVDIAVPADPAGVAKTLARELGGSAFPLDEGRATYRVSLREGMQIDVAALRGNIGQDLALRDFTINAMAVRTDGSISPGDMEVVDPTGGRRDLDAGLVRAIGEANLADDPLRLLRAFRLAGQLGFGIEEGTLALIQRHAGLIRNVSAERVRDELYIILGGHGAHVTFRALLDAGLLWETLPEVAAMEGVPQGEPHVHDLVGHSLNAMRYAEEILADPARHFGPRTAEVGEYLSRAADGGLTMAGLVKLCAFLHDAGKPPMFRVEDGRIRFIGHDMEGAGINAALAERLKLSALAADCLVKVTEHHMRPLHMSHREPSPRAIFRYVRDMGEHLPASLVVALADAFATRERADILVTDVEGVVMHVAEYYYGEYRRVREEPFVRGRDLIEIFGLAPGPVFGEILGEVEERRVDGLLRDRDEAVEYVRGNLHKWRDKG